MGEKGSLVEQGVLHSWYRLVRAGSCCGMATLMPSQNRLICRVDGGMNNMDGSGTQCGLQQIRSCLVGLTILVLDPT